jgi:hypothetical protein
MVILDIERALTLKKVFPSAMDECTQLSPVCDPLAGYQEIAKRAQVRASGLWTRGIPSSFEAPLE